MIQTKKKIENIIRAPTVPKIHTNGIPSAPPNNPEPKFFAPFWNNNLSCSKYHKCEISTHQKKVYNIEQQSTIVEIERYNLNLTFSTLRRAVLMATINSNTLQNTDRTPKRPKINLCIKFQKFSPGTTTKQKTRIDAANNKIAET